MHPVCLHVEEGERQTLASLILASAQVASPHSPRLSSYRSADFSV